MLYTGGVMRNARILTIMAMLLGFAILLLASCAGGKTGTASLVQDGLTDPGLESGLPPIPGDQWSAEAQRGASAIFSYELNGSFAFDGNGQTLFPGSYALYPEDGAASYVIYRFGGIDPAAIVTALEVHMLDQSEAGTLNFGFADFQSSRWSFTSMPIDTEGTEYQLREVFDPQRHVSPAYAVYLAIVVQGESQFAEVEKLLISADGDLVPPEQFTASDAWYSDRVQLNWSEVPNVTTYDIQYKLASEGDESWALLKSVAGDKTTANHNDDDAIPCLYDVVYDYRIQARTDTASSEFSVSDSGYRRTPAPRSLVATDRMFEDRVELWFPIIYEDNATIDVYRDAALIADDEPLFLPPFGQQYMSWADTTVPDQGEYEYYIVVNGDNGSSEPSPKDTGCIGEPSSGSILSGLGQPDFFAAALEFGPQGGRQIGIAYYDADDKELEFLHTDPFIPSLPDTEQITTVSMESNEAHMGAVEFAGRPFLAYANDDAEVGLANVGLYLAWPDNLVPTADEDWNTLLLDEGRVYSESIAIDSFAGGIGILYTIGIPLTDDREMRFCWIPDPSDGTVEDVEISIVQQYPSGTEVPLNFDLVDYNGLPYALYGLGIQGTSRLYGLQASSLPPQGGGDWVEHLAVDALGQFGSAQGIDLEVHDGRLHAAVGIGNGESDCLFVVMSSLVPVPAKESHWDLALVTDLNGNPAEGVSLMFGDESVGNAVYVAVNEGSSNQPRLFTPVSPDRGRGITYEKWVQFEFNPSAEFEDIRGRPNLMQIADVLFMTGNVLDNDPGDERRLVQFAVIGKNTPF